MKSTIMVLTNRTAASDDLFAALRTRDAQRAARFEFVIPPDNNGPLARSQAQHRLDEALAQAREAGFDVTGHIGDCDALVSVTEAYDPARHDEIVISTLPASTSHWLQIDLPARAARATGALVSHVAVRERRRPAPIPRPEPRPGPGLFAPFRVLGWGRREQPRR
jgi:hypothetical protein